jgi:hypothetical protein
MNMANYSLQAPRAAGRPSAQHRNDDPANLPMPQRRAVEMAETMREVLYRDGNVTTEALLGEGFTSAEVIEHGSEAERHMRALLTEAGWRGDRLSEIIEKAICAAVWIMPMTAGVPESEARRQAWRDYCVSVAAHRLDPWVSQSERCNVRLKIFLDTLALLPRERNAVINAVVASFKRRVQA